MKGLVKYKGLAFIIALVMAFAPVTQIWGVELNELQDSKKEEKVEVSNPEVKAGEKPVLGKGEAGVLIDTISGNTLFEADSERRMYPASTTKIMTCMLAIEAIERGEASLDDKVEVTAEMLDGLDPDGSNIALKEGEILSLDSLLKGLMIPSGNDAAMAIAAHIGKGIDNFVAMMNNRAQELGAVNTSFRNPSGLHDEYHYTTAKDMAMITRQAMSYAKFRNIVDIAHVKIPPTNKTEKERYYINTNGLISNMRYVGYAYKGATGVKTGYTSDAGNCLVSSATRDGVALISVILGGKGTEDSHKDSIEMLNYGFKNYVAMTALYKGDMPCEVKVKQGRGTDSVTLSVKENLTVVVPKDTKAEQLEVKPNLPDAIYAPVQTGYEAGTISVFLNGEELAQGVLLANRDIERSIFWPIMALGEMLWSNKIVRIVIYIAGIAVIGFAVLFAYALYENVKRPKRRKRRRK